MLRNLAEAASVFGGNLYGNPENPVNNVLIDSRLVQSGDLFIAIRGKNRDGHLFVDEVLQKGGNAVVSKNEWDSGVIVVNNTITSLQKAAGIIRKNKISSRIVAVTGSSGKTTTREMIFASLKKSNLKAVGTTGNLNNHLGLPLTILNLDEDADVVVLELGMNHTGELAFLGSITMPDITLITNIGRAHIEFFKTHDEIAHAKSELLMETQRGGLCLIPSGEQILVDVAEEVPLVIRSIGEDGDLWFEKKDGEYCLQPGGEKLVLQVRGKHNAANAVFAVATAEALGIDRMTALDGISTFTGITGRGEVLNTGFFTILDESYNANPDSMLACLEELMEYNEPRVAVLGDMLELGDESLKFHREILSRADLLDLRFLILVGSLFREASDVLQNTEFRLCDTAEQAQDRVRELMKQGDTILVKGSHSISLDKVVTGLQEEA